MNIFSEFDWLSNAFPVKLRKFLGINHKIVLKSSLLSNIQCFPRCQTQKFPAHVAQRKQSTQTSNRSFFLRLRSPRLYSRSPFDFSLWETIGEWTDQEWNGVGTIKLEKKNSKKFFSLNENIGLCVCLAILAFVTIISYFIHYHPSREGKAIWSTEYSRPKWIQER